MEYNLFLNDAKDANNKELLARTFKATNSLGARDIFQAKKKYDADAYAIRGPSPVVSSNPTTSIEYGESDIQIDGVYSIFNDTKLPLYGTVDKNVIPLRPKRQYLSFYLESNGGFTALDFVVNSFINMRRAYSRGMFEGKGIPTGFVLSNLEVVKSMDDGSRALQAKLDSIIKQFIAFTKQDNTNRKKIVTPEHFVNYFTNFLLLHSRSDLVNYSSMVLTDSFDINYNGLCLDIADVPYDSDKSKVKDIILDPNFSFYLDTAVSFGFFIAKEYPFKLIANLNSFKMRDNICTCGKSYLNGLVLNTADEVVDFYYEPAYLGDFGTMRNLFDLAYNSFYNTFRFENVATYYNGSLHTKRILRYSSQSELIQQVLSDHFLMSIYIRTKNNEMRLGFSDKSLSRFEMTAKLIYDKYGLEDALKYINHKFRLAIETLRIDKKGFTNIKSFSNEEALALIRLTRYDY
jgi:hypothetical protein